MGDERGGKDPEGPKVQSDRAKLIHNEQVKLTANTINGTALAFIVGGGVATMISSGPSLGSVERLLQTSARILTGFVLHCAGRLHLRLLR